MIVRIKLRTKEETKTMMFGNSYKNWNEQFRECCSIIKNIEVLRVETSRDRWIGWGGLKWCNESVFQDELNREGCQQNDPDNPNPRIYANMNFRNNPIVFNMANKIAKRYQ